MRTSSLVVLLLSLPLAAHLHAQDLAGTCRASSSYDLTLRPDSLRFDRPQPAPFHVELHDGALRTDGTAVRLNAEDQDRLALFERELRALAPRVRVVAQQGVDLAARSMREEAAGMQLSADTLAELDRRLDRRAAELKQRIAASNSTHDWQGDVADRYASQIASDILPLLAADLGQQAITAAVSGDMQAAASLRDRAADLSTQLRPRLERRMQALRPQIQALCPSIRRLAELQQGVRGGNGRPLELVQVGG
ncbi:hypothetical protein ASG87_10455 [Frateuria sp. Soil773]|uniref:DUF2884 family protein n=1 Tax=Frateuria sp. Soil773 TaxID=1736407 RepID=UPI000701C465|nr:DUF2884 family protein [Frateuria sp. Soil773]KRF01918.1 hypothetical protein ASG87_10455 [Frateuria sp. Soil773]